MKMIIIMKMINNDNVIMINDNEWNEMKWVINDNRSNNNEYNE